MKFFLVTFVIFVHIDFTMLIIICIGVSFVILIVICVALIIIKFRRRDHSPPSSAMLLHQDFKKIFDKPHPVMPEESNQYRSLIKVPTNDGGHMESLSQSQFQPGPSAAFNPHMDASHDRQFSTIQHGKARPVNQLSDSQNSWKDDCYAPNYIVLDTNDTNKNAE